MKSFIIFLGMMFLLGVGLFLTLSEPLGTFDIFTFIIIKSIGIVILIVFYQLYKKLWGEQL